MKVSRRCDTRKRRSALVTLQAASLEAFSDGLSTGLEQSDSFEEKEAVATSSVCLWQKQEVTASL